MTIDDMNFDELGIDLVNPEYTPLMKSTGGGFGICNQISSIEANCDYKFVPYIEFWSEGGKMGCKIYNKSDGQLAKDLGPIVITARSNQTSDIPQTLEILGKKMLARIKAFVDEHLHE